MILRIFTANLFKLLSLLFFPCTTIGRENVPLKGGFILASNHISNLDPPLLGITSGRWLGYVAKDSLFKNKLLGAYLKGLGAFPIKRATSDLSAVKTILKVIAEGTPVLFFPEGTRKKEEKTKRVESGIGLIAVKSGVPIIPAFVIDTDKAQPIGAKFFRRHAVKVLYGKPFHVTKDRSYPEIANQIMDKIEELGKSAK